MAGNQKNFQYFTYLTDQSVAHNIKGESGGAFSAIDGHAAPVLTQPLLTGINKRNRPRYAIAEHTTTFRRARGIIYTPTAFAAIVLGSTVNVATAGNTGTTAFTVIDLQPEKLRRATASSRNLADI